MARLGRSLPVKAIIANGPIGFTADVALPNATGFGATILVGAEPATAVASAAAGQVAKIAITFNSGVSSATGAPANPGGGAGVPAGKGSATATASNAVQLVGATPSAAMATGTAETPSTRVTFTSGVSTATGTAFAPGTGGTAPAGTGLPNASAFGARALVGAEPTAGAATAIAEAAARLERAGLASGQATAFDARFVSAFGAVEAAFATAVAFDTGSIALLFPTPADRTVIVYEDVRTFVVPYENRTTRTMR